MKSSIQTIVYAVLTTIVLSIVVPNPSYANSWLWRQQMVRQNQMAQQRAMQQRQQAMRAQQRQQQQARQQQSIRQQQAMRAQQQRMRQQMVQRQQAAARQRQAMAQKQRNLQLQRQKRIQSNRPKNRVRQTSSSSALKQKALQTQRTLRQQRLAKERAERLRRLRLEQKKKQQRSAQTNQSNNVVAMASFASRAGATSQPRIKATDRNKFRQSRLTQGNKTGLTKQLANQRKFVQSRAKKIQELQKKVKTRQQNQTKNNNRKKQVNANAKKQFKNCNGKYCECSFQGDTRVLTSQGLLPIRDLVPGQSMVWARNDYTGESDWKLVTHHYSNNYDVMLKLSITDTETGEAQTINSNAIHPFFVQNSLYSVSWQPNITIPSGSWVPAHELKIGDALSTAQNSSAIISAIERVDIPFEAFNLTVAEFRTYYVEGEQSTGNNAVWVHNDCPGSGSKSMLGYKGVKLQGSKTLWTGKKSLKGRIDVENPNPGQRPGQVHYQIGKVKHLYDPKTRSFPTASKKLNREIKKDRSAQRAIHKAMTKYLGES